MKTGARTGQTPLPGTPVEVFSRFNATWVSGFEIVTSHEDGYELRRLSDRAVLPKSFLLEDVRPRHQYRR